MCKPSKKTRTFVVRVGSKWKVPSGAHLVYAIDGGPVFESDYPVTVESMEGPTGSTDVREAIVRLRHPSGRVSYIGMNSMPRMINVFMPPQGCVSCDSTVVALGYGDLCWRCADDRERAIGEAGRKLAAANPRPRRPGYEDYESQFVRNGVGTIWRLR